MREVPPCTYETISRTPRPVERRTYCKLNGITCETPKVLATLVTTEIDSDLAKLPLSNDQVATASSDGHVTIRSISAVDHDKRHTCRLC